MIPLKTGLLGWRVLMDPRLVGGDDLFSDKDEDPTAVGGSGCG